MQNRLTKIFKFFVLAPVFLTSLVGCNTSSDVRVTLISTELELDITLKTEKGTTFADLISQNQEDYLKYDKYADHELANWFTSKEAAAAHDEGVDGANLFETSAVFDSDATLYAGYYFLDDEVKLNEHVATYLGSYQDASLSPFPFVTGYEETTYNNDDLTYVTFNGITKSIYENYKEKTLASYEFSSLGNDVYLDKTGSYKLTLAFDEPANTLKVSYAFNDPVGEFPTYYFSSAFSGLDAPRYINEANFMLSKNYKDEDLSKKYQTYSGKVKIDRANYDAKVIFYTPKEKETALDNFNSYIEDAGVFSEMGEGIYIDMFATTMVQAIQVDTSLSLFSSMNLDLNNEMVGIFCLPQYEKELDTNALKSFYKQVTGYEFSSDDYVLYEDGTSFGGLMSYSFSDGRGGVGYTVTGAKKSSFDIYLAQLIAKGWIYSESEGDYTYSFTMLSSTQEYALSITYYDSSKVKGLLGDSVNFVYSHNDSVFQKLTAWLAHQNVGGGTITAIPEFSANSYSFGNLAIDGTTIPYGVYVRGIGVAANIVETYEKALVDSKLWVKNETSTEYPQYDSVDGYYSILLFYTASSKALTLQIIYNTDTNVTTSLDDVYKILLKRLGVETFTIPNLDGILMNGNKFVPCVVSQYYDGSNNRCVIAISYKTEEEASASKNLVYKGLEDEGNGFTYVGTNSTGTTTFYKNADGVYFYSTTYESTDSKDNPVYVCLLGMYIKA